MRPTKSVKEMSMKMSKAEIAAREKMEAEIVTNQTFPKASTMLSKAEKKVFSKLKRYNDNFTEADSTSLNMLAQYIDIWNRLKEAHNALDITDERSADIEKRMTAIDKQIAQHMTALCIPLSQRLRLSNELAKVMIEQQKLEQMNQAQTVNPLLAMLEDDDDE